METILIMKEEKEWKRQNWYYWPVLQMWDLDPDLDIPKKGAARSKIE